MTIKKLIALLLGIGLVLSFTGCNRATNISIAAQQDLDIRIDLDTVAQPDTFAVYRKTVKFPKCQLSTVLNLVFDDETTYTQMKVKDGFQFVTENNALIIRCDPSSEAYHNGKLSDNLSDYCRNIQLLPLDATMNIRPYLLYGFQNTVGNMSALLAEHPADDPVMNASIASAEQIMKSLGYSSYTLDFSGKYTSKVWQEIYGLSVSVYNEAPLTEDVYLIRFRLIPSTYPAELLDDDELHVSFLFDKNGLHDFGVGGEPALEIVETFTPCSLEEALDAAMVGMPRKDLKLYDVNYTIKNISLTDKTLYEGVWEFHFMWPAPMEEEALPEYYKEVGAKGEYIERLVYVTAKDCVKLTGEQWDNLTTMPKKLIHKYNTPELFA